MALVIRNTKELINPDKFKMKVLIFGLPSTGKTKWLATAPNPGVAACETGEGNGMLSVVGAGIDYVEPTTKEDFETFCEGKIFQDKESLGIDSLSEMTRRFIKDFALTLPRAKGDSPKRRIGIPELDDYGAMGEVTRRLLRKILDQDKHVVVTATEKYKTPDPETGQGETIIGPDLPGELFTGSAAMFDFVFRLRSRPRLKDPKDAKTRYIEHYMITQPDGAGSLCKCRPNQELGKAVLPQEIVIDLATGKGCFPDVFQAVISAYREAQKALK